ncbi:MAG: capsid cement protein [Candidatus Anammoxibacter sp.]
MATNRIKEHGRKLSLTATHPASPSSGDNVRVSSIVGVALTDERTDGTTTIDIGGVYDLSVKAVDDDGNSAVTAGDKLFYVDADIGSGSGFLSKKVSGYFAGLALEAITSGSTSTINVLNGAAVGVGLGDQSLPRVNVISESVAFGDFTDGGSTTGLIDLTPKLPAQAIPLGFKADVTTGFSGDTTAVIQVGISGDVDRFSIKTDQSVLATGKVGSLPATDGADGMDAEQTVRVTVTGGADFTSIDAGVMIIYVYYLATT